MSAWLSLCLSWFTIEIYNSFYLIWQYSSFFSNFLKLYFFRKINTLLSSDFLLFTDLFLIVYSVPHLT